MAVYKPKEKILTEGQLSEWWGISIGQLTNLRLKNGLPFAVAAKGVYIFKESWINEWLEANKTCLQDAPQ